MQRLTASQKGALKKHSVHHTQKHMSMMSKAMSEGGKSFSQAHKLAQKKVGK